MTGYDDFMNDYGKNVRELMQLLARDAYQFAFVCKNIQFALHISLPENEGIAPLNGLSGSVYLHNLLREVNADVMSRQGTDYSSNNHRIKVPYQEVP